MKVIFLKDLKGQGKKGDVKEVSDGYANNFLIAKGYAKQATSGVVNLVEQQKNSEKRKKDQIKEEALRLAEQLKNTQITIKAKAGEAGRLFGAVTNKQIAEELEKHRIEIDKRKIILDEPIRLLGSSVIQVKLHHEVTATLTVTIIDEK